jgi:hypothetical protein
MKCVGKVEIMTIDEFFKVHISVHFVLQSMYYAQLPPVVFDLDFKNISQLLMLNGTVIFPVLCCQSNTMKILEFFGICRQCTVISSRLLLSRIKCVTIDRICIGY